MTAKDAEPSGVELLVVVDDLSRRVLAPNASPMTLDGTNTWLLGDPAHGAVVVVDPGPDDSSHFAAVAAQFAGREVAAVVITHHHHDHAEAAGWAQRWGAPLRSFDPGMVPGAIAMRDGEELKAAGVTLRALHTPGHASDHLCLRLVQTDSVLTGDHVLGRGSSVVNWPDGDMAAYMRSLARLAKAPGLRLLPGHGPVIDNAAAKIAEYQAHRRMREEQVLDAIEQGASSPNQVVAAVYADVPSELHPAARRSVMALLHMLADHDRIDPDLLVADGDPDEDPPDPSTL